MAKIYGGCEAEGWSFFLWLLFLSKVYCTSEEDVPCEEDGLGEAADLNLTRSTGRNEAFRLSAPVFPDRNSSGTGLRWMVQCYTLQDDSI